MYYIQSKKYKKKKKVFFSIRSGHKFSVISEAM